MHFTPFPVVDHLHHMHDHLNTSCLPLPHTKKKESLWRENLQSGGTPRKTFSTENVLQCHIHTVRTPRMFRTLAVLPDTHLLQVTSERMI